MKRTFTFLIAAFMLLAFLSIPMGMMGQTTYKLEQVTSVEAGGLYVFEQGGHVMNNTVSSSALQTTTNYVTTGLSGTESYVWTLEAATNGFYMKNVKLTSSQYLNNTSSTSVSFGNKSSVWNFNFQDDQTVLIQNYSNSNRFLGYTTSTSYAYKAYATNNLNSYPHAIKVYKLVEEGGGSTLEDSDLALVNAPVELEFDLYNNSNAQTISYTTSSTGAVTVSQSNYITATVNANNTITVTPVAVTNGPQTITINQAADDTYAAGSVTFTVDIENSTPSIGTDVTFDATVDTGTSPLVKDGVTFTCSNGVLDNGSEYRLYKNSTTTFSVSKGIITKIVFTCTSGNPASGFASQTGWTTNGNNGTWTGNATSVSFTATGAQVRATKIVVTVAVTQSATFTITAPENVAPGDVIDVNIRIAGDYQANTLTYFFHYNADAFEYQSKTNGAVITAIQEANENNTVMFGTNNPGLITCGILAPEATFSDEGILFTVHFKVKEEAELGTYDFVNEIKTFSYYPSHGIIADIPYTTTDASVTVTNVSGSVTLHTNGVVGETQTVYGSIELPTAENVAGYAFAGWTADENDIQLVSNPYTPSGSVDLYAVYSKGYEKVTSNLKDFSGEYLIVYEGGSLAFDGSLEELDAVNNTIAVSIANDVIASNATTDAAKFTIEALENGYSIKSASGKYIGQTSDGNGINTSGTEAYTNSITYNNGIVDVVSSGGAYLRYNSNSDQTRFRYFKSSTYTSQKAIQLYKRDINAAYYTRVFAETEPLSDVTITGPSVIPAGYTLNVTGVMSNTDAAKLVIEDGAQLVHNSDNVKATVRKNVAGYGTSDGGWHLFASPVDAADATPLKTDSYDLFKYNEPTHYWYNDKVQGHEINTLEKGVGYLYAIPEDQMVQLAGTLVPSGTNYTIEDLSYTTKSPIEGGEGTENNPLPGFNLVGNPFACDAYVDRDYMVLNADGDGFVNGDGVIHPFQGVFVQASATGQSVTFSRESSNTGSKITLNISQTRGEIIDNATVALGEGSGMYKFYLNSEATRLYIPKGNTDYAVAYADGENEMPVNFVAAKNGTYTISVVTKNIAMDYLHLIDNLTGADVDLITTPSYTFEARTSDYASRFRLLFRTNGIEEPVAVEHFAYITNGNLVIDDIDGEALVQIIDQTGRILSSERFSGSYSKQVEGSAGLYFVRLVTGNMVRTQKIVIE